MSYLLDALRKAERERQLERTPDLAQLHESEADDRNDGLPAWVAPVVAALVLLNLAALSAFWLLREPAEPIAAPRQQVPVAEPVALQPEAPPAAFDAAGDYPEPAASAADLPVGIRDRPPSIELNGHLYSSIPGRSFVLVDGRRYREGERLSEGPAVESIDETGAVLNDRGERFRVAAPR